MQGSCIVQILASFINDLLQSQPDNTYLHNLKLKIQTLNLSSFDVQQGLVRVKILLKIQSSETYIWLDPTGSLIL